MRAGEDVFFLIDGQLRVVQVNEEAGKPVGLLVDALVQDGHQLVGPTGQSEVVLVFHDAAVDGVHLLHGVHQPGVGIRGHDKLLGILTQDADRTFPDGIDAFFRPGGDAHQAEEVVRRGCEVVVTRIPPFLDALEGVGVAAAVEDAAAFLDPFHQMRVGLGVHRLHVGVGHHEDLDILEGLLIADVLDVGDPDWDAPLQDRHRHPVEVAQLRVFVTGMGGEALEHQGVAHQDADPLRPGECVLGQGHVVERPDHHLHHRGVVLGDADPFLAVRALAVQTFIDALRPGHDLIVRDPGIEQLGRERGVVVLLVVDPVTRPVLDRVGQEPDPAAGRRCHGCHAAVFQVGGLEGALLEDTVEVVRHPGRAGPDLGDVAVDAGHRSQACFRADDVPLGIIKQGMGRDITFHVHPLGLAVLLGEGGYLVQRTVVQVVLQFAGEVGGFGGLVLRAPGTLVVVFPFPFEGLAVAAPAPEFGFFEIECFHAGVYDAFDLGLLEVLEVVEARDDIGDHVAVPDGISFGLDLAFVQMHLAVPLTCEVVLVTAPGDAGHEVDPVAAIPPGLDPVFDGGTAAAAAVGGISSDAVHHHGIGPVVDRGFPGLRRLERGFHPSGGRDLLRRGTGCQPAQRQQG